MLHLGHRAHCIFLRFGSSVRPPDITFVTALGILDIRIHRVYLLMIFIENVVVDAT